MQTYACLEAEHLFNAFDWIDRANVEQVIRRRHPVERLLFRHIRNHKVYRIRVILWTHDADVDPLIFSFHVSHFFFRQGPLETTITKISAHLLRLILRFLIYTNYF